MEIVAFSNTFRFPIICFTRFFLLLCFSFRDRVVRTTPANAAQLNFLERLEDNDDVSSTLSKIQR